MFKINFRENAEKKGSITANKQSFIGEALFLKGEISGEEDVFIEGQFKGTIKLPHSSLTVNKGGRVEAEIHAKNININGEVKGNVFATEKVCIATEGQITGDISAPRISIADGAQFKGNVRMNEEGAKPLPLEEVTPVSTQNKK